MAIHLEHPERTEQIEAWAEIMWRVDDLRMDVDEFRHNFEQDTESLWALAYWTASRRESESVGPRRWPAPTTRRPVCCRSCAAEAWAACC
jgi:hypothetical protein